jgi:uncharacterized protein DUF6941
MSVTMPFGHLTDYATSDASGKLIIVGIFEIVFAPSVDVELIGVIFSLVARLECSIVDGLEHDIRIRFVDGEEEQVGEEIPVGVITFSPTGPGRPFAANVMAKFAGLQVRGADDYRFVILVDGRPVGAVPLYVQLAPGVPEGS